MDRVDESGRWIWHVQQAAAGSTDAPQAALIAVAAAILNLDAVLTK